MKKWVNAFAFIVGFAVGAVFGFGLWSKSCYSSEGLSTPTVGMCFMLGTGLLCGIAAVQYNYNDGNFDL